MEDGGKNMNMSLYPLFLYFSYVFEDTHTFHTDPNSDGCKTHKSFGYVLAQSSF
jgi:hypothetical protein